MESVFKKDGKSIGVITSSDIKNVPITDIFQINWSYTITASQVFKIGEYYDIWITVKKNSGYFGTSDETIGKFKGALDIKNIFYGCFDSYSEWDVQNVGYIAIQTDSSLFHKSVKAEIYRYTRIHCAVRLK